MKTHEKEYQLTFSGLPFHPPMVGASNTRLFASWWQQEVHVYQILEERSDEQYRQVARLCLKGEESIADVALSPDGSLLAVVTPAELKLFNVVLNGENGQERYQIRRINISSKQSGKFVQISPDSRWLVVVSHSNEVRLATIQDTADDEWNLEFKTLHRLEQEDDSPLGSLGNYQSSINKISFSPSSNVLAVSDLSGKIDCWQLQQASEPTPKTNGNARQNGHLADSDSSDSDSDSEDELETVFGTDAWKLLDAVDRLPRLDSPALALSFRQDPSINPNDAEQLPELFVITAAHHLSAFDLSTGSFTEWSKRNPREVLPEEFQQVRDRAKGMIWGPSGFLWIYGTNFLFGLDITVDHTPPPRPDLNTRKRKRGAHGAGGEIHETEKTGLIPEVNNRIQADDDADLMDIDSDVDVDGRKLLGVYRGKEPTTGVDESNEKKKWKMIHKFRTILGIVPIKKAEGREQDTLEVVVVERPIFDLDLPSRFESIHAR
jgi:U3 small nucleolar RNA-associated protein 4